MRTLKRKSRGPPEVLGEPSYPTFHCMLKSIPHLSNPQRQKNSVKKKQGLDAYVSFLSFNISHGFCDFPFSLRL